MALEQILNNSDAPVVAIDDKLSKKEKRARQARINGSKSKGPITAEGKKISSANAIRHGLTASEHTLLAMESPAEYNEVYNAWVDKLRPADKAEMRLVEKVANIDWRLERFVMMETCILNLEVGVNVDDITARFERIDAIGFIVEAWKQSSSTSHCLDLLRRYLTTLQHQFNSTMRNFRDLEKHRLARAHSGRNLEEEWGPLYQPPQFKTFLYPDFEEDRPAVTSSSQKEPTKPLKIAPPERPAA